MNAGTPGEEGTTLLEPAYSSRFHCVQNCLHGGGMDDCIYSPVRYNPGIQRVVPV